MEDFRIEIATGVGAGAAAITVPIERFTLVGATTRTGQLTTPLLSRFGIVERFEFYSPEDLTTIIKRSVRLLDIPSTTPAPASWAGAPAAPPLVQRPRLVCARRDRRRRPPCENRLARPRP